MYDTQVEFTNICVCVCQVAVTKEALEDKLKGPVQKAPVVQRGRFSVTSDDGGLEVLGYGPNHGFKPAVFCFLVLHYYERYNDGTMGVPILDF